MLLIHNHSTEYRIVHGKEAGEAVVFAAAELAAYLEKITGVTVPVCADDTPATEKEILVGATNRETAGQFDRAALGADGFTLETVGDRLFIIGGGDRGTLYGVYELLEAYVGCRFYTSTFERVPTLDRVELPEIRDTQTPHFVSRGLFWYDYRFNDGLCAKRRINAGKARPNPIAARYGGSDKWAGSHAHTLYKLAEMTGPHIDQQPCLSDEKVYETVLKNVRAELAACPDANLISISQNDSWPAAVGCTCDKCKAQLEETGSYAGSVIRFVNRIADVLKEEYPNVTIHTFAYRYTRRPPVGVVPRDNVTVELCSIEGCFRHPLAECHRSEEGDALSDDIFTDLLEGWSELCPRLSLWDYTTDFANYNLTFPNFAVLRKNLQLFADHKVAYMFEQGNGLSPAGEFAELRGYLLAKLLWNPYISEEAYRALAEEFIEDYYGKGAPYMKEYLALALEESAPHHATIYAKQEDMYPEALVEHHPADSLPEGLTAQMVKAPEGVDWSPYTTWYSERKPNRVYTQGEALFRQALAAEEDEILHNHIDAASVQILAQESGYHYRRLLCVKENLETACGKALAGENLPEEEKAALIAKAVEVAMAKETAWYEGRSRHLHDMFHKHGIIQAVEGLPIDSIPNPNYNRDLTTWHRRDDGSRMA